MPGVFSKLAQKRRSVERRASANRGFAYVEVLIAAALIAIVLPAALQAGFLTSAAVAQESRASVRHEARVARMEFIRGTPYSALLSAAEAAGSQTVPSLFSDDSGDADRVLVRIARYDGDADPFTVADPDFDGDANAFTGYRGLLWVEITTEGAPGELLTLVRPNQMLPGSPS